MSTTISPSGSLLVMLLALVGLGCSGGESPPSAGQTAGASATETDPAAADARTYTMACARCHAEDGAGNGQLAGRLGPIPPLKSPAVAAMSTTDIEALIRSGRGAMPPHDKRLDARQIRGAAAHVRRLNGRSP